ncbi:FMN-binding protein [Butyricicoccus sp.]|uniref:FMN-binding protein n=1 Tax=Butyricicoccus sp. TaxID=2049021 RepID=UPI003F1591E4
MRIFHNETVDRLAKRLIPGIAVAGLAAWGIAYGGPELENVPGLIPLAEAVDLENGESASSGSAAGTLAALNTAGQGETSSDPFTDGTYKDGTYTGTARGFGGNITVKVTISGGKIEAIDVVSAPAETPSYFARAKGVISKILSKQSPNVDTVSGATYSSNGIINAVKRALTQASGGTSGGVDDTPEAPANPTTPTEPVKPDDFTDGTYKDGTYTGTAEGFGGDITVKVTIAGGKITAIDVVSAKDETPSYFEKAKAVIAQVIAKQTPNVDTVSGATYSSNGILNAVRRALTQASGEPEEPEQPDTPVQPEEPTPVQPDENTETEDIVYSADISCVPDEYGDFDAYDMTVAVTVRQTTKTETKTVTDADGQTKTVTQKTVTRAISNIAVTRPDASSENWRYITWALDGRGSAAGIKAQAIEKQSFDGLDAVSRATCSSKSLMEAGKTLDLALGTTVTEEEQ